jgi:hypothetical protein
MDKGALLTWKGKGGQKSSECHPHILRVSDLMAPVEQLTIEC